MKNKKMCKKCHFFFFNQASESYFDPQILKFGVKFTQICVIFHKYIHKKEKAVKKFRICNFYRIMSSNLKNQIMNIYNDRKIPLIKSIRLNAQCK